MSRTATGAETVCAVLEAAGIRTAFGVPGSESVELFYALQRSPLRTVLTVDERAAAFMAQGYFRTAGRPAAVLTVSGPGFASALGALAEARHDSAALVMITVASHRFPEKKFRLQVIDQPAMATPVVKQVFTVTNPDILGETLAQACTLAVSGEPGPVFIEMDNAILTAECRLPTDLSGLTQPEIMLPPDDRLAEITRLLTDARRPVIYAGLGATFGASSVLQLAETLGCPVLTTCSGRGIIPEIHPLSFYFDYAPGSGGNTVNEMLEHADCVLALGVKFTHNGTGGFRLKIDFDTLVHLDASAEVLNANYPAKLAVETDVPALLVRLLEDADLTQSAWTEEELSVWHDRLADETASIPVVEPMLQDGTPIESIFRTLSDIAPEDTIFVTDCGLHQTLARRYLRVRHPGGLLLPADFQSMGYGLPAAIGAKIAKPESPVIALVGDGCLAMTAMELGTAARENVPLTVIVFNDGKLGLIRLMQLERSGKEQAVDLHPPDYRQLAGSLGAQYYRWDELVNEDTPLSRSSAVVRFIELPLVDSASIDSLRSSGKRKEAIRRVLGPALTRRLKSWLKG